MGRNYIFICTSFIGLLGVGIYAGVNADVLKSSPPVEVVANEPQPVVINSEPVPTGVVADEFVAKPVADGVESTSEYVTQIKPELDSVDQPDPASKNVVEVVDKEAKVQPAIKPVATEEPVVSQPDTMGMLTAFEKKFFGMFRAELFHHDSGKYKELATKEDFYNRFAGVATRDVVAGLTDGVLVEKPDGLYVLGQCGPFLGDDSFPFEVTKINDSTYQLVQAAAGSELFHPNMTITVTFEYMDKWVITDIAYGLL